MGTSHDHLDWPRLSYREQFKEGDEEADRRKDGWTGLEWNTLLRKAENREEWRKLVVKSTVVPQRQPDYGIDKKIRRAQPAHVIPRNMPYKSLGNVWQGFTYKVKRNDKTL